MQANDDLEAARQGDADAIMRLIQRHEARLRRLVHDRLGPQLREKISTSDVLQSAYLDLIKDFGRFRGATADEFIGWFAQLVEHNVRDKVKFFEARKRAPPGKEPEAALGFKAAAGPGPYSLNALFDDLQAVHGAMGRLSEDHRAVIQMKFVDGLSHEQIADRLGRSVAATRALLVRARATLLLEIDRGRNRDRGREPPGAG